jgi:DNA polymerase-3 subunit alpha
MQIAQQLAGFSLAEADTLRKAVGKKIKKLLLEQKDKFIQGCIKNNINTKLAEDLWHWIEPFARYGFNRSHAASYAMIAFQTAYLKTHYPVEFMAALLTSEGNDIERIAVLIKECQKMGIEVLPPDINESFRYFSVVPKENKIRFGLLGVKNVGESVVNIILEERKRNGPFQSMEDFLKRLDPKALNKKALESLIKSGALDKFGERGLLLNNLEKLLEFGRQAQRIKSMGQKNLFDLAVKSKQNNNFNTLKLEPAKEIPKRKKLEWEKELLGLYITGHPLEGYQEIFQKNVIPINEIKQRANLNQVVRIGGLITDIKKVLTRNGQSMLFVQIEDFTDKIEIVAFPSIVEKNSLAFREGKIVFLKGRVSNRDYEKKIICEEIQEVLNHY